MSNSLKTSPRLTSLSLVSYFHARPDVPRLIDAYRQIAIDVVGDIKVEWYVGDAGEESKKGNGELSDPLEVTPAPLGVQIVAYRGKHKDSDLLRVGRTARMWETIVEIDFSDWVSYFGERCGPLAYLSFYLDILPPEKLEALPAVAAKFFRCSAAHGQVASAFGDIGDYFETCFGLYYSGTTVGWLHPHRHMNQYLWAMAGEDRLKKARGIYWANYFGPEIVARMGSPEQLFTEYTALEPRVSAEVLAKFGRKPDTGLAACFPDGAMSFLLTRKSKGFMYPYGTLSIRDDILERYAWLHGKLRAVDALL